jgi:hypothetical protein
MFLTAKAKSVTESKRDSLNEAMKVSRYLNRKEMRRQKALSKNTAEL